MIWAFSFGWLGIGGLIIATEGSDGLPGWAQVAIVLAMFFGTLTKQIVPGWMYNDQKEAIKKLEVDKADLIKIILDTQPKTVAALETGTKAVNDAMTELRYLRRDKER